MAGARMTSQVPDGFEPMPGSGAFVDDIGPVYQKRVGEDWRFGMRVEARHANPAGVTHGGVLMTFLDHILGKLVWDALEDKVAATIGLNTDLLAAARPGDWIEAEGEVTALTASIVFARGRARAGETMLATASGVWKILGPR